MQFIKDTTNNVHLITGLDDGAIRVDEATITGSLILSADAMTPWPVNNVGDINSDLWQVALDARPEIILLGTGTELVFPQPSQLESLYARQIGVEVMNTEAACRTYNLLVHEHRKVVAALILS
ncbi:MAG: MTH938/NDUFAF3 family protein [Pseudomonadota bacterium]